MGFRVEYWQLRPAELPVVRRHCAGCGESREFVCSERFRSNAQKKVLDIWLLYRCSHCAEVWKYPIVSRRRVSDFDPRLHAAFESNDSGTVWRYAFDLAALRLHATCIGLSERVCIERRIEMDDGLAGAGLAGDVIRLAAPWPCGLRLERLLALYLPLSRSELQRRYERGGLLLEPAHPAALRRAVRDGQRVCFIGGIEVPTRPSSTPATSSPS
jgi:hypothetical protein